MRLAFCLYRYFPFGGLERDFLRIARACLARGHELVVYTGSWEGEPEAGLTLKIIKTRGFSNHSRCRSFSKALQKELKKENYDLVMGFNKMPGLDLYYAADVCYAARIQEQKSFLTRLLPRYRSYLRDEKAVFSEATLTSILVLAQQQAKLYQAHYKIPKERFTLLPPGIAADRKASEAKAADYEKTKALRQQHDPRNNKKILLFVAASFKTKGLDRVLAAMASLPEDLKEKTQLWIVGPDKKEPYLKKAQKLGLTTALHFFGGQKDLRPFFMAADFLIHPAYHENTGTVLLEALVAGLPLLTLDLCGYAPYIIEAEAGLVLATPFDQRHFNLALAALLVSPKQAEWKKKALAFAEKADLYSLPQKALAAIEAKALEKMPKHFDEFMQLSGTCFREQKNRRTLRVELGKQSYIIKQHQGVGFREIFKNLLQGKLPIISAKNEVEALKRLEAIGIPAPTVKAYGYRGLNPAKRQSFILMEELKDLVSLEDFCKDWKTKPPSFTLKKTLIAQVATLARRLHDHGINHRDFYLCHFLLNPHLAPEKRSLYLLDLHRALIHKRLPRRWRLKDLVGLYFSSKDCGLSQRDYWRFLSHYREKPLKQILATETAFWQQVLQSGEMLYHAHAASH